MVFKLKKLLAFVILCIAFGSSAINYYGEPLAYTTSPKEPLFDYFNKFESKYNKGPCLRGYVYWDQNSNGQKDVGEPGVPGIGVIWTCGPTNSMVAFGVTNMVGYYTIWRFPDCDAGLTNFTSNSGHHLSLLIGNFGQIYTQPSTGVLNSPWSGQALTQLNFGIKPSTTCCTSTSLIFDPPALASGVNQNGDYLVSVCPYGKLNVRLSDACNGTSYYWLWGDEQYGFSPIWPFAPLQSQTGLSVSHSYSATGTYTAHVFGKGANNCLLMRRIIVTVTKDACEPCCACMPFVESVGFQNLSFFAQPFVYKADLCPLSPVSFTASCPEANSYDWDFGDGVIINGAGAVQSHQYTNSGSYVMKVKTVSTAFCKDQLQQFNITVSKSFCDPCCQVFSMIESPDLTDLTLVGSGVYKATVCAGKSINLGLSSCSSGSSFFWDFGDGGVGNGLNVSHNYAAVGNYDLTLTVDGAHCHQKQIIQLTTIDCSCSNAAINMPNGGGCINYPVGMKVTGCPNPGAIYNWSFGDGATATGSIASHVYAAAGNYSVSVTIIQAPYSPVTLASAVSIGYCPNINACKDCIGSFAPEPGEYILSVWVKEDYPNLVYSYPDPALKISFSGSSIVYGPFGPDPARYRIIDGWQKIEEKITVPANATNIKIDLINNSSVFDCYFDDIRIHPVNATMKSYVYDPITLRLSAELDENNYATYYEYDEEGKLIRVKKETEKGVMTIKESRRSVKK